MRSLLVCSILAVGLSWAQHSIAAEPKQKHAAPAVCEHSLADFLGTVAAKSKHMAVSPSLTSAQYSFVQGEIKKHSSDHKVADGDGAMVIDSDGVFLLAATQGDPAGVLKVCTIVPIPGELVAAIVAIGGPPAADVTPPAPKADPERPWL